jgi:hypothetical protein
MAASTAIPKWSSEQEGVRSQDFVKYQYQRRVTYTVLLGASDDISLARGAAGLPKVGWQHPTNFFLRVTSVTPRRVSPIMAEVDVDYESQINPDSPNGGDPTDQPPRITIGFSDTEIDADQDVNGKAMMTPNKEIYRGLRVPSSDLVITITRNLPSIDIAMFREYKNATNSDSFLGEPPGTAWLKGIGAQSVGDVGNQYWQAFAEVHFRRAAPGSTDDKAWWLRTLRQGFYVKPGIVVKRARDLDGNLKTQPTVLKDDGSEETDENATNIWDYFEIFPSKPFAALGLV